MQIRDILNSDGFVIKDAILSRDRSINRVWRVPGALLPFPGTSTVSVFNFLSPPTQGRAVSAICKRTLQTAFADFICCRQAAGKSVSA